MTKLVIEKLNATHNVADFDCGKPELDRFILRYALQSQQSNSTQTYVACRNTKVIGYHSLTVGSVIHRDAPPRVVKGMPQYPIPIMILARLAVDQGEQGQGIGKGLLKDAFKRSAEAANIAGIRAIVVHAKDEEAREWYQQFDLAPSPTDPLHLYLLMKDISKAVNGQQ